MATRVPDIWKPAGGRTERDVAAEVCVRILQSGLVSRTPQTIARMAAATGVPIDLIRQAWALHESGRKSVLDASPVTPGEELPPTNRVGNVKSAQWDDTRLHQRRRKALRHHGRPCRRDNSGSPADDERGSGNRDGPIHEGHHGYLYGRQVREALHRDHSAAAGLRASGGRVERFCIGCGYSDHALQQFDCFRRCRGDD
jgi:hypothetical protein